MEAVIGAAESNIVNRIMMDVAPTGARLFKNIRGKFRTLDGLRIIAAGLLVPGASDLIGFRPVVVTQDMVGKTIAVFSAIEVKAATNASKEQINFINFIADNGGFAGIARSPEDARKIMQISG